MPRRSKSPASGLRLKAMPLAELAALLTSAGGVRITEGALREDVAAGFPLSPDGSADLVLYAAWLAREVGRGD